VTRAPKYIREASYFLLSRYIKRVKEEIEIEAAVSSVGKSEGIPGLPEELLSIIVDTDILHYSEGPEVESSKRRALDGYLMSWSLIFQYFVDSVRC
jgi:hypothetical protein